ASAQDVAQIVQLEPRQEQPAPSFSIGNSATSFAAKEESDSYHAAASRQINQDDIGTRIDSQRISIDQLRRLWEAKEPVTILDVRTERSFEEDDLQAKGAVRIPPDHVVERAREFGLDKEAWLIAYCA